MHSGPSTNPLIRLAVGLGLFLASLNLPAQSTPSAPFTKLWTGEEVDMRTGDISSDARMMSDINWDSGDVDLIHIETGERTGLTGGGYSDGRYAWKSAFSRDGSRIAAAWYRFDQGVHELWVHARDGSDANVLLPADPEIYAVEPLDWSPDDEQILVGLHTTEGMWEIGLVHVEDAQYRKLRSLGWLSPGGEQSYPRGFFSPDGRHVGFDYRADPMKLSRVIHVVPVDGSDDVKLLDEGTVNRFLGWTADGNHMLIYSDRENRYGIWSLGKTDQGWGEAPKLLATVEKGLVPFRRTNTGFAFGVTQSSTGAHIAKIDSSAGRLISPPKPLHPAHNLTSEAADFSPDGTSLAYLAFDPYPYKSERLVIVDLESGADRSTPFPADIHVTRATFRWVDDRSIILFGARQGVRGIFRLDPETGEMNRLPEQALSALPDFKWFETDPSGGWLYTVIRDGANPGSHRITAVEIKTGKRKLLGQASTDRRSLAVSPDGRSLAYLARNSNGGSELRMVSTSGDGESRLIYRAAREESLSSPVAWAADGKSIFFVGSDADSGARLSSISVAGDPDSLQTYGSAGCCIGHDLSVHPDGKRLMFLSGKNRTSLVLLPNP